MQRNIQPSHSSLTARLGPVIGAFASVVFWLVLAATLPASTVARYVPEAAPWVPIACYALAVYSLVAGLRRLRGAVLAGRGRQSQAASTRSAGTKPASRPMGRSSGGGGRSANDNPGGSGSVQARYRPTVQRMR